MTSFMNAKPTRTMSNEIKVGDKVRVREDAPRMYLRTMSTKFLGAECGVFEIIDGNAAIASGRDYIVIPLKYLVKVEEEKKGLKVGDKVEELVSRKSGRVLSIEGDFVVVGIPYDKEKYYWHIDSVELIEPTEQTEAKKKPNVGSIKIPIEVDLSDSYWDAYAADLAKELALKVANKFNAPHEAAEYAVKVAKSVVEGLKRK